MRKQTQAAESILTKLRFRDDELKTWQVSRRAIKISMFYSKHTHFHGSRRCLKMEILFFLLLTTNCCNFFDDSFSRQEVVPISVKPGWGGSAQGSVICHGSGALRCSVMERKRWQQEAYPLSSKEGLPLGCTKRGLRFWPQFAEASCSFTIAGGAFVALQKTSLGIG